MIMALATGKSECTCGVTAWYRLTRDLRGSSARRFLGLRQNDSENNSITFSESNITVCSGDITIRPKINSHDFVFFE